MTAGLNVPADSKPSPCGATIGSEESRSHSPKGGANWTAVVVAIATTARNETTQALVNPLMKFSNLVMLEISLLTGELVPARMPCPGVPDIAEGSTCQGAPVCELALRAGRVIRSM